MPALNSKVCTKTVECSQDPLESAEDQLDQQRVKTEKAMTDFSIAEQQKEHAKQEYKDAQQLYFSKMEASKLSSNAKDAESAKLAELEESVAKMRKDRQREELESEMAAAQACHEADMAAKRRRLAELV